MGVQIISNTVQRYNGVSYYLCGNYYQRKGVRLHRLVWEQANGAIPHGYHIHHIDGDRNNNQIDNLALLKGTEHLSGHMRAPERIEISRVSVRCAIAAAPAWHKSEVGLAWHSARGKANWETRSTQTYFCTRCGKEFTTKHIYGANVNRFCHANCKAAYRREKLKCG